MAIGERIHHFRLLRGFTQKYLGQQLGFSDSQADVRIAQYEKGARSPKEKYLKLLEFRHFVEFFSFNRIAENHKALCYCLGISDDTRSTGCQHH